MSALGTYVLPAVLVDTIMAGAFVIDSNTATAIGALVSTVLLIWAIIKWVDSRIGSQVKTLREETTLKLDHHNTVIVGKLEHQNTMAAKNQELLLLQIKNIDGKLSQRRRDEH